MSDSFVDFVSRCLKSDEKERISSKQILQHPFILDNTVRKPSDTPPPSTRQCTDPSSPSNPGSTAPVNILKNLVNSKSIFNHGVKHLCACRFSFPLAAF